MSDVGTSPYYDLAIKFGAGDVGLRRYGDDLQIVNVAGSGYKSLWLYNVRLGQSIRPDSDNDRYIRSYDNTLIATINKTTKNLDIARLGNSTISGGITLNVDGIIAADGGDFLLPLSPAASPVAGYIYWHDVDSKLYVYRGTSSDWREILLT